MQFSIPSLNIKSNDRSESRTLVLHSFLDTTSGVINLNWLPIRERIELSLLKMAHKSLYYEGWLKHLQLEFQRSCSYNLRSSDAPRLSVPRETDTFKSMAARSFNSLPDSVRQLIITIHLQRINVYMFLMIFCRL